MALPFPPQGYSVQAGFVPARRPVLRYHRGGNDTGGRGRGIKKGKSRSGAALRVSLIYSAFASAWILGSDRVLLLFSDDPDRLVWVSTAKGWLFVVVTALLLFALVGGEISRRLALEGEIARRLEEKEALLREIHHRVGNNLQVIASLLSLEHAGLEGKSCGEVIDGIEAKLRAMALAHENLYESGDSGGVELASYLGELAARAAVEFGPSLAPAMDLASATADLESAVFCGLVLSEEIAEAASVSGGGGRVSLSLRLLEPALAEARLHVEGGLKAVGPDGIVAALAGSDDSRVRVETGDGWREVAVRIKVSGGRQES